MASMAIMAMMTDLEVGIATAECDHLRQLFLLFQEFTSYLFQSLKTEGRDGVPGQMEAVISGIVVMDSPPLDHAPSHWTAPGQQYLSEDHNSKQRTLVGGVKPPSLCQHGGYS